MKKLLFFILLSASLKGLGQNKHTWELIVNISGIANSSPKDKLVQSPSGLGFGTPIAFLVDSVGNSIYLPANIYSAYRQTTNTIHYKSKLTAGFTFGGRLNYSLNKNFDISIGGTISFMSISRMPSVSAAPSLFSGFSSSDSIFGSNILGDSIFIGTAGSFFSPTSHQTETFIFSSFNVPISLRYKIARWRFEAAIVPTFIINSSKKKTTKPNDAEINFKETPFENNQKTALGVSIGPSYQITKQIGLGIEYVHGLTTLIDANSTRKLLSHSVNLKLLYKL